MSSDGPAQTDLGFTDPNPTLGPKYGVVKAFAIPIVSVLLAFAVGGILIYFQGVNPFTAYRVLFESALGDSDGYLRVMQKSTPLIFTGLAFFFGLRL